MLVAPHYSHFGRQLRHDKAGIKYTEFHAADLSDEPQVEALFRQVTWRHGQLDILVNIAGGDFARTRTLAMTLGKHGIRINAVAPGMIEVETIKSTLPPGVWAQVST